MVPLSVTLEEGVGKLGMNMMQIPGGLAVVRQIAPKSWAHRQGLRPGDVCKEVGGVAIKHFDDLAPILGSTKRPLKIDFLRKCKVDPLIIGPSQFVGVALKELKPHPIYQVEVQYEGGCKTVGEPKRFKDFVHLKDKLKIWATPALKMPDFPDRFLMSKMGFMLSSGDLEQRRAGLDVWTKALVVVVPAMPFKAQEVLSTFLGGGQLRDVTAVASVGTANSVSAEDGELPETSLMAGDEEEEEQLQRENEAMERTLAEEAEKAREASEALEALKVAEILNEKKAKEDEAARVVAKAAADKTAVERNARLAAEFATLQRPGRSSGR